MGSKIYPTLTDPASTVSTRGGLDAAFCSHHAAPSPAGTPGLCSQGPWDCCSASELDAIFHLQACLLSGCCWQFFLVPRCMGPQITMVLLWSRRPQEKFIHWWAQSRKPCPQAPYEFQLSVQKEFCCLSSSSRCGEGPRQILSGSLDVCPAQQSR